MSPTQTTVLTTSPKKPLEIGFEKMVSPRLSATQQIQSLTTNVELIDTPPQFKTSVEAEQGNDNGSSTILTACCNGSGNNDMLKNQRLSPRLSAKKPPFYYTNLSKRGSGDSRVEESDVGRRKRPFLGGGLLVEEVGSDSAREVCAGKKLFCDDADNVGGMGVDGSGGELGGESGSDLGRRASGRLVGKERPCCLQKKVSPVVLGFHEVEVEGIDLSMREWLTVEVEDAGEKGILGEGRVVDSGASNLFEGKGSAGKVSPRLAGKTFEAGNVSNLGVEEGVLAQEKVIEGKQLIANMREEEGSKSAFASSEIVEDGNKYSPGSEKVVPEKSSSGRRLSSKLSDVKRPYYGSSRRKSGEEKSLLADLSSGETVESVIEEIVAAAEMRNNDKAANLGRKRAYQTVKEKIRLSNKDKRCFVVEDYCRSACEDVKKYKKGNYYVVEAQKEPSRQSDLKVVLMMIETEKILISPKRFGNLQGIGVGCQFYSRDELVVVGLHGHLFEGIDYMKDASCSKLDQYKSYEFPLAMSIVVSAISEDDRDKSELFVYTALGGNGSLDKKRKVSGQVMIDGNLALRNNMEQNVPVRVIRGHNSASSSNGKVYTYGGLYKVNTGSCDKNIVSGFSVIKYQLNRLKGQSGITTKQVHYNQTPRSILDLCGMVCDDISGGQERIAVPAFNVVDNPPVAPTGYEYSKSVQLAKGLTFPTIDSGCSCEGACTDPRKCSCAKLNGSGFPYVDIDGGRLNKAKAVVFECGPNCKCGPNCINRTSQQGLRFQLEVFRTPNKGWAVRSWDFIPAGAPVCEYVGTLMHTKDLDNVSENDFIFEIDCLETIEGLDGRENRAKVASINTAAHLDVSGDKKAQRDPEFCLDGGPIGSVARFINHSCDPNLFVQCVLSSHHDIRLARVMLFAAENIPPLQELTYDYGYPLDSVIGPDGKIKVMPCCCGAEDCRKRLF